MQELLLKYDLAHCKKHRHISVITVTQYTCTLINALMSRKQMKHWLVL